MPQVLERISWAELTTFKAGGSVRYVAHCSTVEDIEESIALAKEKQLPFIVLGEGSNVLPEDDDFEGVVLQIAIMGITEREEDGNIYVTASAGESWDRLVEYVTMRGWWGVENLAGIPGTVGAAPVQNIGAYGVEVRETLLSVDAYDCKTGEVVHIPVEKMNLSYRDSVFKHENCYIILRATFRLSKEGVPHIGYPDLKKAGEAGVPLASPHDIAKAVRTIRSAKFPDLSVFGTAGSFFKNPILTPEAFASLSSEFGAIPSFPHEGKIKVPLAFILDHILGLKGYRKEHVFLFGNQPLVIVAEPGAHAKEIEELAQEIEKKVFERVGLSIEREVRTSSSLEYKNFF